MSIQANINQTLSLASLLASQSPAMKFRKEGMGIQATQEAAVAGLKDIEKNLRREELTRKGTLTPEETAELQAKGGSKVYTERELNDMEERAISFNKDIYDAKAAATNPKLARYIKSNTAKQSELGPQLTRIQEMTQRAREGLAAKQMEHAPSKEFVKQMEMPESVKQMETPIKSILEKPSKTILEKPSSTKVVKPSSTTVEKPKLKTDEFVVVEKPETTTIKR